MGDDEKSLEQQLLEVLAGQVVIAGNIQRIQELFPAIQRELEAYRMLGTIKDLLLYMTFMIEAQRLLSESLEGEEILGELFNLTKASLMKEYPTIYTREDMVLPASVEDPQNSQTAFSKEDEAWLTDLGKDFQQG